MTMWSGTSVTTLIRRDRHQSSERAKGFLDQLADVDLAFAQHQLAGFGAADLEHVLDDMQQPPGAAEDVADIFAVLGRRQRAEHLGVHDFGKADDGVERRPQFVAHRSEKALLRAFGGGMVEAAEPMCFCGSSSAEPAARSFPATGFKFIGSSSARAGINTGGIGSRCRRRTTESALDLQNGANHARRSGGTASLAIIATASSTLIIF